MKTNIFFTGTALLVAWTGSAQAQTTADVPTEPAAASRVAEAPQVAPDSAIGDIVVTAQRRSQRLQDVGISISAPMCRHPASLAEA